jgi:polar amino acid transport system substrate-binding protein
MLKNRKLLSLLLALSLVTGLVALTGCGAAEEPAAPVAEEPAAPTFTTLTEGTLVVGSDLDYPPFESLDGETPEGFDVDLVAAIAEELGLKVEWKKEIFDTLIPSLKGGGRFDMIASAMTIKAEREEEIDFSTPYFDSNQSITMKTGGTYAAPADFKGKKVGVQAGTTGDQWATENLKPAGAEIVTFKGTTDAVSALSADNVAAIVIDLPVAAELAKDETRGLVVVAQVPTGEQYGFGVSKENPELKAAIDAALDKLKADGVYDEIYTKWFGDIPR